MSPQSCNVVSNTCILDQCGNGTCDEGENCTTCQKDCGCTGSLQCSYGVCVADPCGTMTDVGCCDGTVTVYCDGGSLVTIDCGASPCGWVTDKGWYDCGSSGADPSGEFPLECKGNYDYPSGCAGKECGDNGGGYSCGECAEGKECSDAGVCGDPCVPVCDGKQCGDDGCGGTCGECADGTCSEAGVCQVTEPEDGDSDGGCTAALDTRSTGASQGLILAALMLALVLLRRVRS